MTQSRKLSSSSVARGSNVLRVKSRARDTVVGVIARRYIDVRAERIRERKTPLTVTAVKGTGRLIAKRNGVELIVPTFMKDKFQIILGKYEILGELDISISLSEGTPLSRSRLIFLRLRNVLESIKRENAETQPPPLRKMTSAEDKIKRAQRRAMTFESNVTQEMLVQRAEVKRLIGLGKEELKEEMKSWDIDASAARLSALISR